ncbi:MULTISPECIES: mandelate racemase/muconate lactonizing enzyme family protein [Streptomyces]|uniref:mandelate racemase/muconate lactonizing enzyme family protein n=1 Tax=Streptomyces TaxID=1883 RepID=UPI00103F17C0|nr:MULTISPECIES: mandelate racemase/muconate lactonizing enzyme family protein [Streptomyces]MBT3072876.1 mandelate racemase/muconate lactonizing enzyme family protein [Streptomyces sp. COG21]MBT3081286.1 mandelate racemase/muconate lactonizing enzyme family protein [Streptomyces sp. COG20]MBT3088219.1 mandelate racemase/muconate lactonizing enzyme family protein [Streptomyces sp. CYG21]MBT3102872.1 mandelate racemase/muconate lactonizing enzyme family protein [Streptomyces sp. COG19]MBT311289
MTLPKITGVTARAFRAPLRRPWGPGVPANHVIVAEVAVDDGRTGTGFTWTPQAGAGAVLALLEQDCADAVLGLPAHPETVWDVMWAGVHEAGSGGVTTLAMAAVDTALWDLRASAAGHSLADELGRRRNAVPVYGSGVNLHYSLPELVAQAERWKAKGYRAIKVKVGHPDPATDLTRLLAVREVVGPEVSLMIDANQRWDLLRAKHALRTLAPCDPCWIEEPLLSDDLAGHARLRRELGVPVAVGENIRTLHGFRQWLDAGACDVVQPNVARVGGVTPFRRIAELAALHSVPVYPHLLPELSGQLACALPLPSMVEEVEDASFGALGLLRDKGPVTVEAGELRTVGRPGLGLEFAFDRLDEVAR